MHSRYEILLESFSKVINIEALTQLDMVKKQVIPAVTEYMKVLSDTIIAKTNVGLEASCEMEKSLLTKISSAANSLYAEVEALEKAVAEGANMTGEVVDIAKFYKYTVQSTMDKVRVYADELEQLVGKTYWPFPTYSDLLFGV